MWGSGERKGERCGQGNREMGRCVFLWDGFLSPLEGTCRKHRPCEEV